MYPYGLAFLLNYLHDNGALQPIDEKPAMASNTLKLEIDATEAMELLKQAAAECDYVTREEVVAMIHNSLKNFALSVPQIVRSHEAQRG